MADEVDVANEQTERMMQAILMQGRHAGKTHIAPREDGTCFNDCGDPALAGAPFCSKECADDVEKRLKLSGRSGSLQKSH